MWVIFLQHLYLLLDWLLFRYEEIQDKLRELMVRVSWPSSCEVHFLPPPHLHRRQPTSGNEWSLTPSANQGGPLSLDSTLLLPGQRLMSTDGFRSLDSQQCATRDRPHCSVADCQNPTACASKRCLHCQHFSVQLVHPCHTQAQRVQVDIDLCQACLQPGVENNRGLEAR